MFISVVRRVHKDEKGQAFIQFALSLPLLITVMMLMFEFGRVINQHQSLVKVARETVRYGVRTAGLSAGTCTSTFSAFGCTTDPARAVVHNRARIMLIQLLDNAMDTDTVSITSNLVVDPSNPAQDMTFSVQITGTFEPLFPIVDIPVGASVTGGYQQLVEIPEGGAGGAVSIITNWDDSSGSDGGSLRTFTSATGALTSLASGGGVTGGGVSGGLSFGSSP